MRFALKSGFAAVALLTLFGPALALNPQPEPPGVHHDVNMAVQNSNPTLTTQVSANCGAASGAPNVLAGDAHRAGNMGARPGAIDSGASANVDKCATHASTMGAAAPATHPAH